MDSRDSFYFAILHANYHALLNEKGDFHFIFLLKVLGETFLTSSRLKCKKPTARPEPFEFWSSMSGHKQFANE